MTQISKIFHNTKNSKIHTGGGEGKKKFENFQDPPPGNQSCPNCQHDPCDCPCIYCHTPAHRTNECRNFRRKVCLECNFYQNECQCICSYCGGAGHNASRCAEKEEYEENEEVMKKVREEKDLKEE